jgi:AAHS family 4-hydroxybenzoate transporter-like MFS transporter
MLGMGRFGSIFGSFAGGVLLSMGWGFSAVIAILAVPATLAALIIHHHGQSANAPLQQR